MARNPVVDVASMTVGHTPVNAEIQSGADRCGGRALSGPCGQGVGDERGDLGMVLDLS
jgi:hypothetical protein